MLQYNKNKAIHFIWRMIPYVLVLGFIAVIGIMAALISTKKTSLAEARKTSIGNESQPVNVITLSVQPMRLEDKISLPAQVKPREDLRLKAEVSGQVKNILATEGEMVEEDQVLAEIDPRDYESRLAQIKANFKVAELEFGRMHELLEKKIAAKTKYDEAEARLRDLSAKLDEAQLALDRTHIRAPIRGRLNEMKAKKGDLLRVGDEVAQIIQYDHVKVTVGVPESDVAAVYDLTEAEIVIEALGDLRVKGKKTFLASQPRSLARLYDLELLVPNPEGRILPGMFARVELVKSVFHDALSVPLYAVITKGNERYLFVEQDGKAVKRPVELGVFSGWQVQVTSGLQADDRVIVVGHRLLADGQAVAVIQNVKDPAEILNK